ncbi:DUF6286 domain-containing protein [Phaeacidiphilus oryzae]|uniref:DUF6286 domain-containing protein n=1 Tax=Phaeacidiphilus oryzae TaxID=348818 RepID=UPI0007C7D74A|nr:DUF6286 domain-containing protein [Phaeacidiphilus oryzae]
MRRVPAGIVAAVCAAVCALLLFDASVAAAGRPAPWWRTRAVERLTGATAADTWVIAVAAALALAGLWLLVLALTPGARRHARMAVSPESAEVRGHLRRSAVALLLRDAAVSVPGVSGARVRVRRRRAKVRATLRFGTPEAQQALLERELAGQLDRLGLHRPPRLRLRVARAEDAGGQAAETAKAA